MNVKKQKPSAERLRKKNADSSMKCVVEMEFGCEACAQQNELNAAMRNIHIRLIWNDGTVNTLGWPINYYYVTMLQYNCSVVKT